MLMKRLFTLFTALTASALTLQAYNYSTPGTGTTYTLESLAAIEASHVTKGNGGYTLADSITISKGDSFQLKDGDIMLLGNKTAFIIQGSADFSVANKATVTRATEDDTPDVIRLEGEGTFCFKNVTFDYVGLKSYAPLNIVIDSCSFVNYHSVNSNKGPICFGSTDCKLTLTNSYFSNNDFACYGGSANLMTRVRIENCVFNKSQKQNRNYPVLNLTPGDSIVVRNNVIHGSSELTMVGGISVANLMGMSGMEYVEISGNTVDSCRYGISLTGNLGLAVIKNNKLTNNRFVYKNNANYGGSGIAIYDSSKNLKVRASGNEISGNLWGITIMGGKDINLGKIQVDGSSLEPTDAEYNEGRNVFKNNGNGGTRYDVAFPSGTSYLTVYAQNNQWGVEKQVEDSIESVILHQHDDATLGKVIFMPALTASGITATKTNARQGKAEDYFDAYGRRREGIGRGLTIIRKNDGTVVKVMSR